MILLAILCSVLFTNVYSVTKDPLLIVVSYDAFRYNYFDKNQTPFMSKLKSEGTSADYMKNVFPTKTFPNHFSIATGLYTESHGVVGNSFYDPKHKKILHYGEEMFHYSNDVLPIWAVNEKAGPNKHTGVMMWPGGLYSYQNIMPTYNYIYNSSVPWEERVDTVISWITDKSKPANLVMMYFEEPDSQGHAFGTNSEQLLNVLGKMDKITKYLHDKLVENGLADKANVIHLSDHGMSDVSPPSFINITRFLKPNTYFLTDGSPCLHIYPNKGYEMETYASLKRASMNDRRFNVYLKQDLFERWHFKNNDRTPPIFALTEVGYAFQDMYESAEWFAKEYHFNVTSKSVFGMHGYDNEVDAMHPYFLAYGPNIKPRHRVPPFNSTDLYELFCALLEIKPGPNNGTYENVKDIILHKSKVLTPLVIAAGTLILSISVIGCILALFLLLKDKGKTDYKKQLINDQNLEQNVFEAQGLLETEEVV